jgi:hypothetical protein
MAIHLRFTAEKSRRLAAEFGVVGLLEPVFAFDPNFVLDYSIKGTL